MLRPVINRQILTLPLKALLFTAVLQHESKNVPVKAALLNGISCGNTRTLK